MGKKLNKTAKSNAVTYGIVIAVVGSDDGAAESGNGIKLDFRPARSGLHLCRSWQFP